MHTIKTITIVCRKFIMTWECTQYNYDFLKKSREYTACVGTREWDGEFELCIIRCVFTYDVRIHIMYNFNSFGTKKEKQKKKKKMLVAIRCYNSRCSRFYMGRMRRWVKTQPGGRQIAEVFVFNLTILFVLLIPGV